MHDDNDDTPAESPTAKGLHTLAARISEHSIAEHALDEARGRLSSKVPSPSDRPVDPRRGPGCTLAVVLVALVVVALVVFFVMAGRR
jgi:hypothetical protein